MPQAEFDSFAESYEQDLAKSLAITGENREFYARRRIDWTAQCLSWLEFSVQTILDYGCGDGANVPLLARRFKAQQVLGVDISSASIAIARQSYSANDSSFLPISQWTPDGAIDLAFTNGVFHHIPRGERTQCLAAIRRSLRPRGLLAFWENNPWNPGTRYVMSSCVFDENAIAINPLQAKKLLSEAGFEILRMDSLFYFPRQLAFLRPIEHWFHGLPLGGQYLVLCRNSA